MKGSRRKIWSIPIALVMVLALAAMVGLYGIVQAQTGPSAPSSIISSVNGAPLPTTVATVIVENLPPNITGTVNLVPAVVDDPDTTTIDETKAAIVNRITGGPTYDDDIDNPGPEVAALVLDTTTIGEIDINVVSGAAASLDKASYTFTVEVAYDLNTGLDGSDAGIAQDDDRDFIVRTTVNLYILRVSTVDMFHADGSRLILGDTVSAIGYHIVDSPRHWAVTGVAPNAVITAQVEDEGANFEFFNMGGNKIGLRVESVTPLTDDQSVGGDIFVDIDTATDTADDDTNPATSPWLGDGNKANDRDMTLAVAATPVQIVDPIAMADSYFFPAGCNIVGTSNVACVDRINAVVSIRDDISADHLIHTVAMTAAGGGAVSGQ